MGGYGGFTDYLACSVSKWSLTRGSIKGVRCVISLTTLNSSGESISVPYLGFLKADKAGSIICPMWEIFSLWKIQLLVLLFVRHRRFVLVRSDGVPVRKEKISKEDSFTTMAVSIRVFFSES